MYAKRSFRKATRRPAKRVPRKRGGARKSIAKIVKSIISRQAENKSWFDYGSNESIVTAALTTFSSKNLIPQLAQGTGKSGRVGNEIRIKSGFIRGHVNIKPYNATSNPNPCPVYVKMWIISCKDINTHVLSNTNIANDFFDIVNSSTGPQASMIDMDFTVNKDAWTVYATKTVRLGSTYSFSPSPVSTGSYFDNSPMSVPFSFNFGKNLKTIKYDDNVTTPTNRNMFIIFQCVTAEGGTNGGYVSAEYHYTTRVDYEDM